MALAAVLHALTILLVAQVDQVHQDKEVLEEMVVRLEVLVVEVLEL